MLIDLIKWAMLHHFASCTIVVGVLAGIDRFSRNAFISNFDGGRFAS